jgi:hypothetical protein
MKLAFETWLDAKNYSNDVNKLFKESIICYKNQAYRASLLFSYIGFLTIIKENILNANQPASFTPADWADIRTKITDDDWWEKHVANLLLYPSAGAVVIALKPELKDQAIYWKNRRNDCAHYKNNEINASHTEAFWSFLKSNINKMTVEGGINSLLNKFIDHFDPSKTPRGADFSHLISEIDSTVQTAEMHGFLQSLRRVINMRSFDHEELAVFKSMLDLCSDPTKETLIRFLKEGDYDLKFLSKYPNKVVDLNYTREQIRNHWHDRLKRVDHPVNRYAVYAGMLATNTIPPEEINEANKMMFEHFDRIHNATIPREDDIELLKTNGFYDAIYQVAFIEKNLQPYLWVNSKYDLIIFYIENYPIDDEIVRNVCSMLTSTNPSQWFRTALVATFANKPEKKAEFNTIAVSHSIVVPDIICLTD